MKSKQHKISAGGLVEELAVSGVAAIDSVIRFELMTLKEAWTGMSLLGLSLESIGNMLQEVMRFKRELNLNPPVPSGACAVASTRELASVCSLTLEWAQDVSLCSSCAPGSTQELIAICYLTNGFVQAASV